MLYSKVDQKWFSCISQHVEIFLQILRWIEKGPLTDHMLTLTFDPLIICFRPTFAPHSEMVLPILDTKVDQFLPTDHKPENF